jgi:hypothetical protein
LRKKEEMTFDNIELEPIRNNEITGIVLSPVTDGQNQLVSPAEIAEACLLWNEKFEHLTIQHRDRRGALINLEALSNPETFKDCFDSDFEILSSFTTDTDSVLNGESIPGGSWLLSLRVENPKIFELIKEERLNGYSIGGLGIKTPNGTINISSLLVPEISIVQKPAHKRDFLIIKQLETILNPFISEFSCRLPGGDPDNFQKDSFRRMSRESGGKRLDVIIAKRPGKDTTEQQAFRYPLEAGWTKEASQAHCSRHKGQFEDIKRKEE